MINTNLKNHISFLCVLYLQIFIYIIFFVIIHDTLTIFIIRNQMYNLLH